MVNGRPCEYCKDNTKRHVSENKLQFQQLDEVFLITNYLTAYDQKTLSKKLQINEKDIRLLFRKKRAKEKKESETEENADISTFICKNDRVPHCPHLLHGPYDSCHFISTVKHRI